MKRNLHRSGVLLGGFLLAADSVPALRLPEAGVMKVLVVKQLDAAKTRSVPVPSARYERLNALPLGENANTLVLSVPSVNASRLIESLAGWVQSAEVRPDFDTLDFRNFPIDSRAPQPAYPTGWARDRALPSPGTGRVRDPIRFDPPAGGVGRDPAHRGNDHRLHSPERLYGACARGTFESPRRAASSPLLRLHQPVHRVTPEVFEGDDQFADVVVCILNVPEAGDAMSFLKTITLAEVRPPDLAGDRSYFRLTVARSGLAQLAAFPALVYVDRLPDAEPSGEREAHLIGGDSSLVNSPGGILQPTNPTTYRSWLVQKGFLTSPTAEPTYSSMTVADLDNGFGNGTPSGHADFLDNSGASRVTIVNYTSNDPSGLNADCTGHGTMVAGVIGGNAGSPLGSAIRDSNATGYYMGQGVAPAVKLISGRIFNFLSGSPGSPGQYFFPQPWQTVYADLSARGAVITNNSWNDIVQTYTSDSELLDKMVRHAGSSDAAAPMTILCSAGNRDATPLNSPYVTAPATAKNVIAVGGSESFNPNGYPDILGGTGGVAADNGNQMWSKSRKGPTTGDGRIKPDLVAPATGIESPQTISTATCKVGRVGSVIDPSSPLSQQHLWSRGTSFAAPGAAGAAALLYDWYKRKNSGLVPKPALVRAMLGTLAYDLPTVAAPPGGDQGFGKVDLARAFKTDGRYKWNNQTNTLTPGAPLYALNGLAIKDASRPVKITLAWTDAPGSPLLTAQLKNDLDLVISTGHNSSYCQGNNTDPRTRRSKIFSSVGPPFPTYDRKNNVEQCVFLASELASTFNISVNGISINSDAISVWTPSSPRQDFALFVENVIGQ